DPTNTNIPKWTTHAIRGLKPGTVRVTGTPIDQTKGAKPIEFTVAVKASSGESVQDIAAINAWAVQKMDGIAGEFGSRASKDRWMISELGKLKQQITPQEIEAIYNKTIIDGKVTTSIGELSKSILALRAAGIDPERYHGHNLVAKLSTMDPSANVYEITPYLWALSSDRYHTPNVSHAIDATLGRLLSMRNAEGLWTDAYGGWTDATGFALYALAPYYDRKEVKDAVEMAVDAISEKQYPDGDVDDNSNSLAMVAGGLWSNDRSYLTDARLVKSGKTMLHALKGYELTSGGFVWKKGEKNSNLMATEQAFRALIAYNDGYVFDYRGTDKKALGNNDQAISVDALIAQIKKAEEILKDPARYDQKQIEALRKLVQEANDLIASPNVDRSSIDKKTKELSDALAALKPSGQGGGNGGSGGGGSSSSDITVSFTLEGMKRNSDEKQTWVNKKSYTMPKDSTVESLFKKVLDGNGIKYVDTGNYIKSIRSPFDNEMLSEFTNGQNSGWMYKVNEVRPNVGFSHYKLNNNDDVVWFYTNDYTKEPGHDAGNSGGGAPGASGTPAAPGTPAVIGDDTTPKAQAPSDGAKVLFEDVPKDKWYAKAVQAMVNKGLAKGRSNDRFEPEAKITRAEFIAILARIDGKSIEGETAAKFKDVKASDWYYTSIAWASKNRIAAGDGDNFHPNRPITREEMATMLSSYMRYNTAIKLQNKAETKAFADQDKISGWAKGSVQAMQAAGIIGGRSNDLFEPKAHATRAETMEMLYRLLGE
ncbi:MAG: S-layer homology domain-containing protein, partial [Peptostreptococcaceae bacterium]|nr:S-layer homology domain-containing protein [Peptostreptococcaceae bacterium]